MTTYRMTLTLDVHVDDEHQLRDAAFEHARAVETGIPGDDYSATDSTLTEPGSALVMLTHQAICSLPGVSGAEPVAGEIRQL